MWSRWIRLACVFLVSMAMMHLSDRGFASEPIRIGISLGLTGQYQQPAAMHKRAYELWRDEVNARGGIMGRTVELVILDDNSDPELAKKIYTEFVSAGSVDHIFAPYSSQLTGAVAPIVDAAGFPMLAPGAAADELWSKGYRNVFGILTQASRYTQGMLRLAHDAGFTTVAILYADDSFPEGIAGGTRKWAPYLKLKVLVDAGFAKDLSDLTNVVRKAQGCSRRTCYRSRLSQRGCHARARLQNSNGIPRRFSQQLDRPFRTGRTFLATPPTTPSPLRSGNQLIHFPIRGPRNLRRFSTHVTAWKRPTRRQRPMPRVRFSKPQSSPQNPLTTMPCGQPFPISTLIPCLAASLSIALACK